MGITLERTNYSMEKPRADRAPPMRGPPLSPLRDSCQEEHLLKSLKGTLEGQEEELRKILWAISEIKETVKAKIDAVAIDVGLFRMDCIKLVPWVMDTEKTIEMLTPVVPDLKTHVKKLFVLAKDTAGSTTVVGTTTRDDTGRCPRGAFKGREAETRGDFRDTEDTRRKETEEREDQRWKVMEEREDQRRKEMEEQEDQRGEEMEEQNEARRKKTEEWEEQEDQRGEEMEEQNEARRKKTEE
ncbi:hypothetical protein NDU88_006034 [Pleurodeles waltl]|uniref:Uncharacterized protein n=1 Tax=Pleurodeles waltl TaxID=8319 RepID=A0AAV7ULU7_PLEWA|nr:hypothetical protein NDU88_006034 [Pleurodeles waltl]